MNKTKAAQSIFILQKIEEENLKTEKKSNTSILPHYSANENQTIPSLRINISEVFKNFYSTVSERNSHSPHFPCGFFTSAKVVLFPFCAFFLSARFPTNLITRFSPRVSVLFDKYSLISDMVYLH